MHKTEQSWNVSGSKIVLLSITAKAEQITFLFCYVNKTCLSACFIFADQ